MIICCPCRRLGRWCLGGLTALALTAGPAAQGQTRPSILIVLMDDARVDGVPWLDEMAEEGVRFTAAYATEPQCGPSRAALLTGRYRSIEVNGSTDGFDDSSTLGTRMQAAGYETAFIGKYINGHTETIAPAGWERWLVFRGAPRYFGYQLTEEDGTILTPAAYSTDYLAAAVSVFFAGATGPAFAVWAPYAPHIDGIQSLLPIPAPRHEGAFADLPPHLPPSLNHTLGKPAYLRNAPQVSSEAVRLRGMEATLSVAEAVEKLRGEFPELIVFVTSDNGAGWGEHGWHFQQKNCPHLMCTRIPFVAFGPWTPKEATGPVRLEDLAATVLSLGGADGGEIDGQDLTPLLEQGAAATWTRTSLPFHYGGSTNPVPTPPWDAHLDFAAERLFAAYETGELEEYDLATDPWLLWNIAVLPEPCAPLLQMVATLTALVLRRVAPRLVEGSAVRSCPSRSAAGRALRRPGPA